MRDWLVFAIVIVLVLKTFKAPMIGVLTFAWLSLMNPHRLTYGAAYDFPFAAIISAVTLFSLLTSKEPRRFPMVPITITLMLFMAWMTATSLVALEPDLVWTEWNRVFKTFFMAFIAMFAIKSKKDIVAMAWVVGLSLAFYGVKGGIFTIVSGGSNHVYGPDGSYISDNNALALALVVSVPIVWYLQLQTSKKWLRLGFTGVTILCAISAAGSYSRGALVAGGAMFFFVWMKSKRKIVTGFSLAVIALLVSAVMPAEWFARMHSIDNYQTDSSSLGRINAWHFAFNVAKDNLMGGGYDVFTHRMFFRYAPEPLNHHAAHSIYFQVLGEHGFVGLAIFLLVMIVSWRTGRRIIKFCKPKEELKWAADLAAMCQVSIIGFAVGGAFLTLAYYDLYYYVLVLLVGLEKMLLPAKAGRGNTSLAEAVVDAEGSRELSAGGKHVGTRVKAFP